MNLPDSDRLKYCRNDRIMLILTKIDIKNRQKIGDISAIHLCEKKHGVKVFAFLLCQNATGKSKVSENRMSQGTCPPDSSQAGKSGIRQEYLRMDSSLVLSQSEYERLLEEVKQLQVRLIELTALRDDLVYHVCPSLRALYEEKIASLERELMAAQMYLREKQRVVELLQAELNRRKTPSFEEAEKQAREERKKYEENLKTKAEEAQKFRDYWENQSKWSEHDKTENRQSNHTASHATGSGDKDNRKTAGEEDPDQDRRNGSENRQSTGYDESGHRLDSEDAHEHTRSPAAELKALYRKIVKRLHPDVHPDPTPRERELLNQAHEAYKIGDLEKMRRIWEEITGMDPPEDRFEDSEEGREHLRELLETLQQRCSIIEREILRIRSEYPYTMKTLLEDENAVEERRSELKAQIDRTREMDRQMAEYIEKHKNQMGGKQGAGSGYGEEQE